MYAKVALFGVIVALGGCAMTEETEDDSQTIEEIIDELPTIIVGEEEGAVRVTEPADRAHIRFPHREVSPKVEAKAEEFAPPVIRGGKG